MYLPPYYVLLYTKAFICRLTTYYYTQKHLFAALSRITIHKSIYLPPYHVLLYTIAFICRLITYYYTQ